MMTKAETIEYVVNVAQEYSEENKCDVIVLFSEHGSSVAECVTPPVVYDQLYVWSGHVIYVLEEKRDERKNQ